MYAEVAWVLVSSVTQVHPQIILEPGYPPDYLSVSYGYVNISIFMFSWSKDGLKFIVLFVVLF